MFLQPSHPQTQLLLQTYSPTAVESAPTIDMLVEQNRYLMCVIASLNEEVQRLRQILDQPLLEKGDNKLLASVPDPLTTNPVAALMNFCRHFLNTEAEFRHETGDQHLHTVSVWIGEQQLSWAQDMRKRQARSSAAKLAIQFLNDHPPFVLRFRGGNLSVN